MQAPCKDCADRKPLCHSTCEKYLEFKKFREDILAKKREMYRDKYEIYQTQKALHKWRR